MTEMSGSNRDLSREGETKAYAAIDEVSRSFGEVEPGCGTAVELQCVIDVPWPRRGRFRVQAIG